MIPKLTKNKIKEITFDFENLYGIPYIFAIDGSHIQIITHKIDLKLYHSFYSTLI